MLVLDPAYICYANTPGLLLVQSLLPAHEAGSKLCFMGWHSLDPIKDLVALTLLPSLVGHGRCSPEHPCACITHFAAN